MPVGDPVSIFADGMERLELEHSGDFRHLKGDEDSSMARKISLSRLEMS
jgi:hypothetical protein